MSSGCLKLLLGFVAPLFFGAIFDIIPSAETDQWIADMLSPFMCSTWVAVFSKLWFSVSFSLEFLDKSSPSPLFSRARALVVRDRESQDISRSNFEFHPDFIDQHEKIPHS